VLFFLVFGYMSRRFELEADLFCIDLLGDASALITALEKVGGHFRDVAGWRHFSTADRVRFLADATFDPRIGLRLRRRLRIWKRFGMALLVLALALQSLVLAQSFRDDRMRADLRLGRYGPAAERAAAPEGLDPALARLARLASSLGRDEVPVAVIETRARESLSSGDVDSALDWLDLGALRGDAQLDRVARAVRGLASGSAESRKVLESSDLDAWRTEIEACLRRLPNPVPSGADQ
jgi:hypothetical protein